MKQIKLIDLSNYDEKDLTLKNITGSVLTVTTSGSPVITIKGLDADLEDEYTLVVIDMSNFGKLNQIEGAGVFMVPISGLDKVVLSVSGTGKIKIKEMD